MAGHRLRTLVSLRAPPARSPDAAPAPGGWVLPTTDGRTQVVPRPVHTSAGQTWEGGQGRPGLFWNPGVPLDPAQPPRLPPLPLWTSRPSSHSLGPPSTPGPQPAGGPSLTVQPLCWEKCPCWVGVGRSGEIMVIIKGMVRSLKLCLPQQPLLILEMLV